MPDYSASEEGLAAFLRWAGATPWATFGQAITEATDKGWLAPMPETPRERELEAALHAFVDGEPDPCRLDHEGFCQAHGVSRPCRVATARALLSGADPAPGAA